MRKQNKKTLLIDERSFILNKLRLNDSSGKQNIPNLSNNEKEG